MGGLKAETAARQERATEKHDALSAQLGLAKKDAEEKMKDVLYKIDAAATPLRSLEDNVRALESAADKHRRQQQQVLEAGLSSGAEQLQALQAAHEAALGGLRTELGEVGASVAALSGKTGALQAEAAARHEGAGAEHEELVVELERWKAEHSAYHKEAERALCAALEEDAVTSEAARHETLSKLEESFDERLAEAVSEQQEARAQLARQPPCRFRPISCHFPRSVPYLSVPQVFGALTYGVKLRLMCATCVRGVCG